MNLKVYLQIRNKVFNREVFCFKGLKVVFYFLLESSSFVHRFSKKQISDNQTLQFRHQNLPVSQYYPSFVNTIIFKKISFFVPLNFYLNITWDGVFLVLY